jgi:putative oxygen-independent coproporphyrinogen III oxidase
VGLAIYVHWPFCQSKCPYCDFNSHVAATIDHNAWRTAYVSELAYYAQLLPGQKVTSIFFGGGTPSLMEPATVEIILQQIAKHWLITPDVEITLEANPGSVEAQKFLAFRKAGINRLSLGVQSLRDEALQFLGRKHDVAQAKLALALAAEHFPRFSFDLIYARHNQTLSDWEKELREALTLAKDHLSLYQLTIEPNTQFYTLANRGEKLTAPDADAANMYELTQQILADAGMPAYEISNHAKSGFESRHNLTYWHYDDYIGVGPGAHGRYQKDATRFATEDHKAPEVWLKHVAEKKQGIRVCDAVDSSTAQREALMMNLRLTEGIDLGKWQKKFGTSLLEFLPTDKIARLRAENYLTNDPDKIQATDAGLQRLNAVLGYLLA